MTLTVAARRSGHLTFHDLMYVISHPHLPEHEPRPVSLHREPSYLEMARMSREMMHL